MIDKTWNQAALGMGPWRPWLTDHGSLTQRLRSRFPDFNVLRLSQGIAQPFFDEAAEVGLSPRQPVLVREVLLRSGATPLGFAHTIIPLAGLRGPWQSLAGLGNRSLGSTLFANPRIERFPLAYKRLDRRHPLYRAAAPHLAGPQGRLWARRSHFALAGRLLMVTEVFLPLVLDK
jgi:chorismate--pyruvate lyase